MRPPRKKDHLRPQPRLINPSIYWPKALVDIGDERQRQIEVEGWSFKHDDEHEDGSLADAAACYAATVPDVFKIVDGEPKRLAFIP